MCCCCCGWIQILCEHGMKCWKLKSGTMCDVICVLCMDRGIFRHLSSLPVIPSLTLSDEFCLNEIISFRATTKRTVARVRSQRRSETCKYKMLIAVMRGHRALRKRSNHESSLHIQFIYSTCMVDALFLHCTVLYCTSTSRPQ